jgi:RHH-type rel operon transcriptional repressor/antitoxin RelB
MGYIMQGSSAICIRLPPGLLRELEKIARSSDRPKSYLVRKAIEQYIDEHADYRVAIERLHDRDDEVISSSELRKRLAREN